MTDLSHHYKEREPEETIQIIKDFFILRGFKIYTNAASYSEANTYSNSIRLEYNNKEVLHTNGKGLTPIYAEASGLAELYERFCAYPRVGNLMMQTNLKRHQNLKQNISITELLTNPYIYYSISHLVPELTDEYIQKYIEIYHDNNYITNKYINLDNDQDIIYQDLATVCDLIGTTGLAAGNTIEEALVQGTSEWFERLAIKQFCNEKSILKTFYYLNNENLPKELKERIKFLEDLNYEIRFYDLSYTYTLPVCMLYICQKSLNLFHICFGAAPTFAIAAERCLTEIYQGAYRLPWRPRIIIPSIDVSPAQMTSDYYTSSHLHDNIYIHELCITHSKEIDNYNNQIFLDSSSHNQKELLNHLIKLAKLNDIELFYTDISLSDKIKAIHVISKKIIMNQHAYKYEFLNRYSQNQKIKIFNCFYEIVKYGKNILLNHQQYNENDLVNLIQYILKDIQTEEELQGLYCYLKKDIFKPYSLIHNNSNYIELMNVILGKFEDIQIKESFSINNIYQKYMLYYTYLEKGYSFDQIKEFFNSINFQIDKYSIENFTPIFLIYKIFLEPLINIYNSEEYDNFINSLIKID